MSHRRTCSASQLSVRNCIVGEDSCTSNTEVGSHSYTPRLFDKHFFGFPLFPSVKLSPALLSLSLSARHLEQKTWGIERRAKICRPQSLAFVMKPSLPLGSFHQAVHALTFSNQLNFPKPGCLQTNPYFVKSVGITASGIHQHV